MANAVKILELRVMRNTVSESMTDAPDCVALFFAARKNLHSVCCEDVTSIATFVASNLELEKYSLSVAEMLANAPARDVLECRGGEKAKAGSHDAAAAARIKASRVIQRVKNLTACMSATMIMHFQTRTQQPSTLLSPR